MNRHRFSLFALPLLLPLSAGAIEFSVAQRLYMQQNTNYNMDARTAVAGDVNGDGRTDVIFFAEGNDGGTTFEHLAYVYEQQADGSMALHSRFTLAPSGTRIYGASSAVLTDLDGDGLPEIILDKAEAVGILKRSPSGTYAEVASVARRLPAIHLMVADVNHDGRPDLLIFDAHGYSIHLARGDLLFEEPVHVLAHYAETGTIVDLDGDGVPDLVRTSSNYGINPGIGTAPGAATLAPPDPFGAPRVIKPLLPDNPDRIFPGTLAVGRFTGGAAAEVAVVYHERRITGSTGTSDLTVSILDWSADGRLPLRATHRLEPSKGDMQLPVAAHDIDADGDDDLVLLYSGMPRVLLQQAGTFLPVYATPASPSSTNYFLNRPLHVLDFNGDGCLDIGYPDRGTGSEGSNGYSIHYRLDCPTTNPMTRASQSQPALRQHDTTPVRERPARPSVRPRSGPAQRER